MFSSSRIIAIVAITIAALTIPGQAALAKSESVGLYEGSCRDFIELVDAGDEKSILYATAAITWIEGYLSGVNAMNSESIDLEPQGMDQNVRIELIIGICRKNPDATMEVVAAAYYLTLVELQETPTS